MSKIAVVRKHPRLDFALEVLIFKNKQRKYILDSEVINGDTLLESLSRVKTYLRMINITEVEYHV